MITPVFIYDGREASRSHGCRDILSSLPLPSAKKTAGQNKEFRARLKHAGASLLLKSQAARCPLEGEAVSGCLISAFGDQEKRLRFILLSRDATGEGVDFASQLMSEVVPYEEGISAVLRHARSVVRSGSSLILWASSGLYGLFSPGFWIYLIEGSGRVVERLETKDRLLLRFTRPRHHEFYLLVSAGPLLAKARPLSRLLEKYDMACDALIEEIIQEFSCTNPLGMFSLTRARRSRNRHYTECSLVSDRGLVREVNEDSASISKVALSSKGLVTQIYVMAVADGVGGLAAGEIASKVAVSASSSTAVKELISLRPSPFEAIRSGFAAAHSRIERISSFMNKSLASTLSIAIVHNNELYVGYAGDTRIYIADWSKIRQEPLMQKITSEHRLDPAGKGYASHVITRALGSRNPLPDTAGPYHLQDNLLVLACTDGLYGLVNDLEIAQLFSQGRTLRSSCLDLTRLAKARGGHDNITIAALAWRMNRDILLRE
jgi:serine/threonine protein phosphatase PrpC